MDEVVDGAFFERHLGERTRTVPMSLVAFHAGHPFDVESVGRLCRERGIFFVVEVMQGIGVVLVDVKKIGVPFVGSGTRKGLLLPQGWAFLTGTARWSMPGPATWPRSRGRTRPPT
ncbi:aminotransferase class V-fold PLP-dependent enzyme [Paracoccus versutus]